MPKTPIMVLALDPSGNWLEGKGTTGWCVFNTADHKVTRAGNISASKFSCPEAYWQAHIELLESCLVRYDKSLAVTIEDYILYASKAKDQINSKLETPRLIGILQLWCYTHQVPTIIEPASEIRQRWTNEILHYKGYIKKSGHSYIIPNVDTDVTKHCLDAVRHAVHTATFKMEVINELNTTREAMHRNARAVRS